MIKTSTATLLTATTALLVAPAAPGQTVVGRAVSADGDLNLSDYSNSFDPAGGGTAFTSAGDAFGIFQRDVSPTIPFAVLDDSIQTAFTDTQGIVQSTNTAPFFGIVDTVNDDNPSPAEASATFTFDTSSIIGPATVTFDAAAMGDFEDGIFSTNNFDGVQGAPGQADTFAITASSDGGPAVDVAIGTVLAGPDDAEITQDYTLEDGSVITLNDPLQLSTATATEILINRFQTFSFTVADPGDSFTFGIDTLVEGGSEAIALREISISGVVVPEPASLALLALGGTALLGRRNRG